jgi:hypothetical protein
MIVGNDVLENVAASGIIPETKDETPSAPAITKKIICILTYLPAQMAGNTHFVPRDFARGSRRR